MERQTQKTIQTKEAVVKGRIMKMKKKNKYYLYEDIKQDRNVKYDKPKRKKKAKRFTSCDLADSMARHI